MKKKSTAPLSSPPDKYNIWGQIKSLFGNKNLSKDSKDQQSSISTEKDKITRTKSSSYKTNFDSPEDINNESKKNSLVGLTVDFLSRRVDEFGNTVSDTHQLLTENDKLRPEIKVVTKKVNNFISEGFGRINEALEIDIAWYNIIKTVDVTKRKFWATDDKPLKENVAQSQNKEKASLKKESVIIKSKTHPIPPPQQNQEFQNRPQHLIPRRETPPNASLKASILRLNKSKIDAFEAVNKVFDLGLNGDKITSAEKISCFNDIFSHIQEKSTKLKGLVWVAKTKLYISEISNNNKSNIKAHEDSDLLLLYNILLRPALNLKKSDDKEKLK